MSETTYSKRTDPWVPVGHPEFKWTSGADVQSTWRKHGWVPPSDGKTPVYVENKVPEWLKGRWVK